MTEFSVPPLVVDHDERWLVADLDCDLGEWASATAREIVSRIPGRPGRREEKRIRALVEGAGALARQEQGVSMALLLWPDVAEGIKAVVTFQPVDMAGHDEEEAWEELLASMPGSDPPEVTEIATPAGRCRRIRQRWEQGEGSDRPVGENIGYVWIFPQYGAAVLMGTAFADLLEAGRWRPALDSLAAGVELEPGQGEVRPG